MVSGIYPFLTGAACAVVALGLLQYGRGRRIPFALAVFATLGFSPLAFALLVAVLAGVLLGQARPLAVLRAEPGRLRGGGRRVPDGRLHAARLLDERLVPVRPAGRRDDARLRAGRPVRLRRQPPRALAAHAVRRLPRPQPDRLPAEEPDRLERQPPVPAGRHAAAVAGRERRRAPPQAGAGAAAGRRDGGAGRPDRPQRLLGLEQRGRRAVRTGTRPSSSWTGTRSRATGSRRSPPGATGTPTTWPGSRRWPAAGTARTTSRRTRCCTTTRS